MDAKHATYSRISSRLRSARLRMAIGALTATAVAAACVPPFHAAASTNSEQSVVTAASTTDPEQQDLAQALDDAVTTGKQVEVKSLTTETNMVTARPDGTFELGAEREPVRTDINGAWEPIDTTLHANADGTYSPNAITVPLTFAAGHTSTLVTAGEDDAALTFSWDAGDLPKPSVQGNQLTYPEVRPGVDLVLSVHANGYTDALVVKTPDAARALAADPAEFSGTSTTLDLSMTPEGQLVGTDTDSHVGFEGPPPLAWDSSGGGQGDNKPDAESSGTGTVHELPHPVIEEPDAAATSRVSIEVAPPSAALNDPDTTYPLFLDPALIGKKRITYRTVHSRGWNYGTSTQVMRVGYCGWAECNTSIQGDARSFFTFDISPLAIAAADPVVYDVRLAAQQVWNATSSPQPVDLTKATDYNDKNYPGPVGADLQRISSAAGFNGTNEAWLTFDNENLRQYVSNLAMIEADYANFSLSAPYEGNRNFWKKFNNETRMTIIFGFPPAIDSFTAGEVVACPGQPVYSSGKLQPRITAHELYENWKMTYAFQIFSTDSANNGPWDSTTLKRHWGWSSNGTTVFDNLTDGRYAWRGGAAANVGYRDESGDYYPATIRWTDPAARPFTVDTIAPAPPKIRSDDYPRDSWGRAATSPGTFDVTTPADAAGISYSFNSTPNELTNTTCNYTATGGDSSYAPVVNGRATINAPSTLNGGVPNRLTVTTFDHAHNESAKVTYQFYPTQKALTGNPTNRVELEDPALAKTVTQSATYVSDAPPGTTTSPGPGKYLSVTSSGPSDSDFVDVTFNVASSGYYSLGAQLATCSTCGRATLSIADAQPSRSIDVPTESATPDTTYQPLGGYDLQAGEHTLRIGIRGASPDQPGTARIDYLTVAQLHEAAYSSLQEAFNNHGITATGDTNQALETDGATSRSLSAQELESMNIKPGMAFTTTVKTADGTGEAQTTFTMPEPTSNGDNVIASGQRITLAPGTIADHLDLLVAATCAPVSTTPEGRLAIRHDAPGSPVTQHDLPATVPTWLSQSADKGPKPITMPGYNTGSPAAATDSKTTNPQATIYALEIDVEETHRNEPIKEITLPNPGTPLLGACDSRPRLHVLAMTTRND